MLIKKLQADHWNEMCYQLLKLITKQLKNPGSGRIVGIKSFIRLFGITAALIKVSAAQEKSTARVKLVLLVENEENILSSYYCLYTVNAAGTKVTTVGVKVTTA
ncbi:hypothetical protein Tco_0820473 [Tanacetum coccineum]|uniref:Uncharacterized protein n=1 Tax=Tanacetum coccineum TaxID=301880 RepID=A0ABQ5AE96_9ASTR